MMRRQTDDDENTAHLVRVTERISDSPCVSSFVNIYEADSMQHFLAPFRVMSQQAPYCYCGCRVSAIFGLLRDWMFSHPRRRHSHVSRRRGPKISLSGDLCMTFWFEVCSGDGRQAVHAHLQSLTSIPNSCLCSRNRPQPPSRRRTRNNNWCEVPDQVHFPGTTPYVTSIPHLNQICLSCHSRHTVNFTWEPRYRKVT